MPQRGGQRTAQAGAGGGDHRPLDIRQRQPCRDLVGKEGQRGLAGCHQPWQRFCCRWKAEQGAGGCHALLPKCQRQRRAAALHRRQSCLRRQLQQAPHRSLVALCCCKVKGADAALVAC